MKKFLLNVMLLTVSTLVAVLILELAVRVLFPWYDPARQVCFYSNRDGVPLGHPNEVIRQRTPKGDFDLFSRFNSHGFRDPKDLSRSVPGDLFVVGDSFSFGWGVADGERYSDQLEMRLGRPVYNIAIPGNLKDYQKLLQYARSRGAKIHSLVLGLCMENDLQDYSVPVTALPMDGKGARPSRGKFDLRQFLKTHSAVYLAFSYELQKLPAVRRSLEKSGLARDLEGLVNKNVLDEKILASSLAEIKNTVRSADSAVVLVIPSRMLWTGAYHDTELKVHERMLELLKAAGIPLVDMRPVFDATGHPLELYFKTDPHWNKEGHALAGQALEQYFKRQAAQ